MWVVPEMPGPRTVHVTAGEPPHATMNVHVGPRAKVTWATVVVATNARHRRRWVHHPKRHRGRRPVGSSTISAGVKVTLHTVNIHTPVKDSTCTVNNNINNDHSFTTTHTRAFSGPSSGTTRVSRYQKGKTNLDLPKQETVSGSGISWAICKSAPRSRQITTPAPHHSVFYRPDALPAAQPTASKQ